MPLPNAQPVKLAPNLTIQAPLSRKGYGPGILIVRSSVSPNQRNTEQTLDPEPLQKWAEEGFVCVEIEVPDDIQPTNEIFSQALDALKNHEKCDKKSCYGLIGVNPFLKIISIKSFH